MGHALQAERQHCPWFACEYRAYHGAMANVVILAMNRDFRPSP